MQKVVDKETKKKIEPILNLFFQIYRSVLLYWIEAEKRQFDA